MRECWHRMCSLGKAGFQETQKSKKSQHSSIFQVRSAWFSNVRGKTVCYQAWSSPSEGEMRNDQG